MRGIRVLLLALVIAGAFYFYTTSHRGGLLPSTWLGREASKLELTEAAGPETLDPEEQVNVAVYKKGVPAVVNIKSRSVSFNFFYGVVPEEGQGSGFILDKDGHILTNYHVIANARQVEATLYNRKTYKADLIGVDRPHDLAVIQIHGGGFTPGHAGRFPRPAGGTKSLRHRKSFRPERHHDARHRQLDSLGAGAERGGH